MSSPGAASSPQGPAPQTCGTCPRWQGQGCGELLSWGGGSPAQEPCSKASDRSLPPAVRRKEEEEEVKIDRPSLSLSPSVLQTVFFELAGGS